MSQKANHRFIKNILEYNKKNIHNISNICTPLKECFGISHFAYLRVFNEGRYILNTNNQRLLEIMASNDFLFRTEHFSEMPQYLYKRGLNKLLWPNNVKDEALQIVNANEIYNGFNIYREKAGTLECYLFATDKDHALVESLYKSNSSLLEDFIVYFHKIGHELCDVSDTTKQGVSPYLKKTYPYIENIFGASNPWEKEALDFNLLLNSKIQEEIAGTAKRHSLSPRELQCLMHLSTGKTAKEIARTLNIGSRTVETYIDKLRLKTTCSTQKEIIHWFSNTFSHLLGRTLWNEERECHGQP